MNKDILTAYELAQKVFTALNDEKKIVTVSFADGILRDLFSRKIEPTNNVVYTKTGSRLMFLESINESKTFQNGWRDYYRAVHDGIIDFDDFEERTMITFANGISYVKNGKEWNTL